MTRNLGEGLKNDQPGIPQTESLQAEEVLIGRDVLELFTTAMYVDPITIYREYVQNAADSVDDACCRGLLSSAEVGKVVIDIQHADRTIYIRDNGTGLPWKNFVSCLTAIGASRKRGTAARGFRGIGRLAGLGYAQELIFRSRVGGEEFVSELRWDCALLRDVLRNKSFTGSVSDLVRGITKASRIAPQEYPERFFEVELRGIIRLGSDKLLNSKVVADYLSQVSPVPFAPDFRFARDIVAALGGRVALGKLDLRISGIDGPICRPHRNSLDIAGKHAASFEGIQIIEIPGVDGQLAGIGWILHHEYEGAVPTTSLVRGLRIRCGDIQVGDPAFLDEIFPEARFNAWSVGEVHVVDRRIVPNGRRDHFEQNIHFNNLLNHLAPVARSLARRCRINSRKRQLFRRFAIEEEKVRDRFSVLTQGVLSPVERTRILSLIQQILSQMEKIVGSEYISDEARLHLKARVDALRAEAQVTTMQLPAASPFGHLPAVKRKAYEQVFGLVYECSSSPPAARALIERMLSKLLNMSP